MGHRLSKIYTRTGDDGSTGLGTGERTPKDSSRVEAYGTVDELNSTIGIIRAHETTADIDNILKTIQHRLFDLGGELCIPGHEAIFMSHIDELESALDKLNVNLPPLKEFILPGGSINGANCH